MHTSLPHSLLNQKKKKERKTTLASGFWIAAIPLAEPRESSYAVLLRLYGFCNVTSLALKCPCILYHLMNYDCGNRRALCDGLPRFSSRAVLLKCHPGHVYHWRWEDICFCLWNCGFDIKREKNELNLSNHCQIEAREKKPSFKGLEY